jgi:hypothetical protein
MVRFRFGRRFDSPSSSSSSSLSGGAERRGPNSTLLPIHDSMKLFGSKGEQLGSPQSGALQNRVYPIVGSEVLKHCTVCCCAMGHGIL